MENPISGSCLCGSVAYQLVGPSSQFHWCHCSQCRKVTGSAHVANIFTKPENLKWLKGEDNCKRYDLPGGAFLSNAFCQDCGTRVPWLSRDDQWYIVPAGSLDGDADIAPQDNIFWADRANWYDAGVKATRFDQYPT